MTLAMGSLAVGARRERLRTRHPSTPPTPVKAVSEKSPSVSFPAVQTYSDGKVVRWIEPKVVGAAEPEHPAPVLELLPAKTSETAPAVAATPAKADGKDSLARGMGAGAAIVALGGIGLGLRRKNSARGKWGPTHPLRAAARW